MSVTEKSNLTKEETLRPFGMKDKLSYAAGDFGCNMSFALAGTTFTLFYTQYLGIDSILFGVILIILKFWDAINDPLIGGVVDMSVVKTTGRFRGRFKRFIVFGAVGLIFSSALTFLPIPNAPLWTKITVCILTYMLWDISYTLANVPYGALAASITADPIERSQLSMWRNIGAFLANIPIAMLLPVFTYDDNDNLIGSRLIWVALTLGIIGFFAFLYLLRGTVERVSPSQVASEENVESINIFAAFFTNMKAFYGNRGAVGVTLAAVGVFLGFYGGMTTVTVMFQSYFQNAQISGLVSIIGFLPIFFVIPFVPKLVKKLGKKKLAERGLLVYLLGGVLMVVVPITPDATGMLVYMACNMFGAFGFAFYMNVSYAMVSDSIDFMEWKSGQRKEGTIYAMHSFFRKAAQGIGPALVLFLMVGLGYNEALGADQLFATALNMRYLVAGLNILSAVLGWVSIKFVYNIDKETLTKIQTELGYRVTED